MNCQNAWTAGVGGGTDAPALVVLSDPRVHPMTTAPAAIACLTFIACYLVSVGCAVVCGLVVTGALAL